MVANQNVIVDANGKLMTTSMPATGQWTMTGNDISNNNSGNVIVTSDLVVDYNIDINGNLVTDLMVASDLVVDYSSNLGIGINNPTFPLDINTSTNNTAAYITNFTLQMGLTGQILKWVFCLLHMELVLQTILVVSF